MVGVVEVGAELDQVGLLAQAVGQVDYSASILYGMFYPLAAYWRAVATYARHTAHALKG